MARLRRARQRDLEHRCGAPDRLPPAGGAGRSGRAVGPAGDPGRDRSHAEPGRPGALLCTEPDPNHWLTADLWPGVAFMIEGRDVYRSLTLDERWNALRFAGPETVAAGGHVGGEPRPVGLQARGDGGRAGCRAGDRLRGGSDLPRRPGRRPRGVPERRAPGPGAHLAPGPRPSGASAAARRRLGRLPGSQVRETGGNARRSLRPGQARDGSGAPPVVPVRTVPSSRDVSMARR